jgi:hypothetical protein
MHSYFLVQRLERTLTRKSAPRINFINKKETTPNTTGFGVIKKENTFSNIGKLTIDEDQIKAVVEREKERDEDRIRQEEADKRFRKKGVTDYGMSSFMGEIELASKVYDLIVWHLLLVISCLC